MVLIWRWPKASYNVLSIVVGAIPRREAVGRSITRATGKSSRLLVGGHIFEFRQLLQTIDKAIRPITQLIRVRVFQSVLVLSTADSVIDGNVLYRLHENLDTLHIVDLALQPADYVGSIEVSLFKWLQIDRHSPAVYRGVRAVGPDERRKAFHGRVLKNHVSNFLLFFGHSLGANGRGSLRDALNNSGILDGEKALWNDDIKKYGKQQGCPGR